MQQAATLNELVCPACAANLVNRASKAGSDEKWAELTCTACGEHYPIIGGVPHFAQHLNEQTETAKSFGFAWKAFWGGYFDKESVFGLKIDETADYFMDCMGIDAQKLKGAKVLDAGTGSGRIPMVLRKYGCEICAVDIHESLQVINQAIGSDTIHVYQADLMKLPFKDGTFDYAWSSGVIMATPNPAEAFRAIARKVKPGGRMFISVYGKTLHHYRLFRHLLPFTPRLPPAVNYGLAAVIAVPLYVAFNSILLWVRSTKGSRKPPYRVLGFEIENIEHKSYRSIVLNLFDQLHPKFQTEHTPEEVRGWFEANGFRDIVPVNVVGMVEMRGVKI